VTPEALHSFVLPARAKIEAAVRHVYTLLTARRLAPKGLTPEQQRDRVTRADAAYAGAAQALSRMVVGPASALLAGKRLLIVADGALEYVPFSALPEPKNGRPLVAAHEIVRLPSATALVVLRAGIAARNSGPGTGIAVFADPVFEADDERLAASQRTRPQGYGDELKSSLAAVGLGTSRSDLARLVYSRREAESIAAAAPGNVDRYVDFQANRAVATSPALARHRILHFATHGLLNDETPELSGIVLSRVNEQGKPQDGYLRLHEIYNLRLAVDLVVLSACQTALGKEIRGEGVTSLSRAFLYAGAARVIASLWQVDDGATAELMGRFYRKLLAEQLKPAAALRSAQLDMLAQQRWQFPYFWAAFELQGEWK
jgi:CHAT domain-containing protein